MQKEIRRVCQHCKKADNYHTGKQICRHCKRRFVIRELEEKYKVY